MAAETSVKSAVRSELRRLQATTTPEGRAAMVLAEQLDDAAPRDAAGLSRELRIVMSDLRSRPAVQVDPVDELKSRRRQRLA